MLGEKSSKHFGPLSQKVCTNVHTVSTKSPMVHSLKNILANLTYFLKNFISQTIIFFHCDIV